MDTSGRVDKVFLLHIWACVPFAPLWLFSRGSDAGMMTALRIVAAVCAAYLALRTWIVFRARDTSRWSVVWPVVDVALVTAVLVGIGDAEDPTALLYLLPIAYATLKLSARQGAAVVALVVLAQFGAGIATGTWAAYVAAGQVMHVVFRHFFLLLLASVIFFLSREAQRFRALSALADYRRDLSAEMHDGIQHDLAPEYRHAVLRIVQEAVMNAVNHAGAQHIRVHLQTRHGYHRMTIEDDGTGMSASGDGEGYGLQSMRTRAEALGGRFRAASAPRGGTRVSVMLPLLPAGGKGWPHGIHSGDAGRG
jgi:signal transduction histidine kinase